MTYSKREFRELGDIGCGSLWHIILFDIQFNQMVVLRLLVPCSGTHTSAHIVYQYNCNERANVGIVWAGHGGVTQKMPPPHHISRRARVETSTFIYHTHHLMQSKKMAFSEKMLWEQTKEDHFRDAQQQPPASTQSTHIFYVFIRFTLW